MNDVQKFAFIVGRTVGYNSTEVANALVETGVALDAKSYDLEKLADATIDGLKSSPKFAKRFSELSGSQSNFAGESKFFNITGSEGVTAGLGVLNALGGIFNSAEATKQAKERTKAEATIAKNNLEIAKLNNETEKAKLEAENRKIEAMLASGGKSNLPLYIGLGLGGIVILGLVTFLVVRTSKQ